MTNKRKRQYRIRNWRDYNSALVRRGSLTLWVEQGVAGRWRDTTPYSICRDMRAQMAA